MNATKLLVSVRSAREALTALEGGAGWIDVKEPSRGPMGPADAAVWRQVREVVPARMPLSVAMGEAADWMSGLSPIRWPSPAQWDGIGYRKLGLSRCRGRLDGLSSVVRLIRSFEPDPPWIVVAYLDHKEAGSPTVTAVVEWAIEQPSMAGVLFDTWNKSAPAVEVSGRGFSYLIEALRGARKLSAVAGGLDAERIGRMRGLNPDVFGVRGAACGGRREGPLQAAHVVKLVRAVRGAV